MSTQAELKFHIAIRRLGRRAMACQADVSDEVAVAAMAQTALEGFGRVDILVNNAGVAASAPVQDITVADWDRVLAVHLRGTFTPMLEDVPDEVLDAIRAGIPLGRYRIRSMP